MGRVERLEHRPHRRGRLSDDEHSETMKTKKTLRDITAENYKAEKAWAIAYGVNVRDDLAQVDERRTHTKQMSNNDREDSVLREVGQLLAVHPKVLFAIRQNSGMAYNDARAPIYFYRWLRRKVKMRISDFWGMLTDGRMFAIECKNRTWTKPSGEREEEQQAFLMTIKHAGGVSGFVTSAEQAQRIIDNG